MPNRLIEDDATRELTAIVVCMIAGLVARTLVSPDPFNLRRFIGEMILACMFGAAIYAFGMIQAMGFWQMILIGLLSGMGTTRTLEWMIKAGQAARGQ